MFEWCVLLQCGAIHYVSLPSLYVSHMCICCTLPCETVLKVAKRYTKTIELKLKWLITCVTKIMLLIMINNWSPLLSTWHYWGEKNMRVFFRVPYNNIGTISRAPTDLHLANQTHTVRFPLILWTGVTDFVGKQQGARSVPPYFLFRRRKECTPSFFTSFL